MRRRDATLFLISVAIVAALFWWEGHLSFGLTDEGYLWYGVRQSLHGEVPVRDFQAYEPGRYYWSAAWMWLLGSTGIIALRIAIAAFQVLGVFFGLKLLLKIQDSALFAAAGLCAMLVWMGPRHKLFDIVVAISLIAAFAYYAAAPGVRRAALVGLAVGIAGFFGRNHGAYGVAGSLILFGLLWIKGDHANLLRDIKAWFLGVLAGCVPLIAMLLFVPGYAKAFWESFVFLAQIRGTNLPVPVPWPWRTPGPNVPQIETRMVGVFFILVLAFLVGGLAYVISIRRKGAAVSPVFLACVALALPYAQFAFSRAEASHLAQGIFPCLFGGFVLIAALKPAARVTCLAVLFGATLLVARHNHPGFDVRSDTWVSREIGADMLRMEPDSARQVDFLERAVQQYGNGETIAAMPFWPSAYPLLNQHCPTYELYALLPRTPEFEETEIRRIDAAKPYLILMINTSPDGDANLRFSATHPLTTKYITSHYERLPNMPGDGPYVAYRRLPSL